MTPSTETGANLSKVRGNVLSETTNNDERPGTGSPRATDAALRSGEQAAQTKWVLLVDDHGVFREALGVVLEHYASFSKIVQAESLVQARGELSDRRNGRTNGFDLAVVDLDLPGGDGFGLLEELREATPGVPVIAVTASSDHGLRARASEAGAKEVLATAASGEEIVAAAKRLAG